MRLKSFVLSLFILLFASATFLVQAQEQNGDEDVRGAFLTSRPTSSGAKTGSANRKSGTKKRTYSQATGRTGKTKDAGQEPDAGAAKETSGGAMTGANGGNNAKSLASSDAGATGTGSSSAQQPVRSRPSTSSAPVTSPAMTPSAPLAIGYTLYMRDANGDAVRVDPSREFHNGDRVRIALEPNTDSYLYVFHSENDGPPEMIFPDARLGDGDNLIEAHVPTEIPSSQEQDERLRWFAFYGQPATERLYIVLTREPLPVVPAGDALVSYCQANQASCPWHPPAEIWTRLQKELNARVLVNKAKSYGQAQTSGEREATARGFGLDQSAPAPSVIRMSATSTTGILVTPLDLVHK